MASLDSEWAKKLERPTEKMQVKKGNVAPSAWAQEIQKKEKAKHRTAEEVHASS